MSEYDPEQLVHRMLGLQACDSMWGTFKTQVRRSAKGNWTSLNVIEVLSSLKIKFKKVETALFLVIIYVCAQVCR